MAKSPKTSTTGGTKKSPTKAKKKTSTQQTPAASGDLGPIDTTLAARAAASMLLHRSKDPAAARGGSLRQIKQDLAHPLKQPLGSMFQRGAGAETKHPHLPMGAKGAAGHPRSTGAAANRIGLPRRMGGS
jgi:hypothetical protein